MTMLSPEKQKNGKPKDGLVLRVYGGGEAAGMTHRGYRRIIAEVTECYIKAYRHGVQGGCNVREWAFLIALLPER